MTINRYSFDDLIDRAIEGDDEYLAALGMWFEDYGMDYWNGEGFDASKPDEPTGTRTLYPVYQLDEDGEPDVIVGYSWRRGETYAQPMSEDEAYTVACSLYDGGWRASDREDLETCPDYTWGEGDVEKVCGILQALEDQSHD